MKAWETCFNQSLQCVYFIKVKSVNTQRSVKRPWSLRLLLLLWTDASVSPGEQLFAEFTFLYQADVMFSSLVLPSITEMWCYNIATEFI